MLLGVTGNIVSNQYICAAMAFPIVSSRKQRCSVSLSSDLLDSDTNLHCAIGCSSWNFLGVSIE